MYIIGYQTLKDKDNIDEVESFGPYKCTAKNAWLGHGYYFWDTDIRWAHNWGESKYSKDGYLILECQLDLSNKCFDIWGSVRCQLDLEESVSVMEEQIEGFDKESVTIPEIIEFMKKQDVFNYNSIRSFDSPNPIVFKFQNNRYEFTVINQRVQICVLNKKEVIKSSPKVIFP